MKKALLTIALPILLITNICAQAPDIQWQKSLGGTEDDVVTSIQLTADGGYIVAGYSWSNNGNVSGNHGGSDFWVVKLGLSGNIQWQKSLGGTGNDYAWSIQLTADGGYIVAGYSDSNDGDVSGNHGGEDCWIVKLDATGTIQWQKSLGGTGDDSANSIQLTADGGYIMAGRSSSNDGDVSGHHGSPILYFDFWVVKLNSSGNIQWQKSLGGTYNDLVGSIQPTADGGYIAAGATSSNDSDVSGNHGGDYDSWVVKLNSSGAIQWQKCFGGTGSDGTGSILPTADGGYIMAGSSNSNNGDVSGNHGGLDCWIVKMNSFGNIQWQKSLGGTGTDYASSIQLPVDGGYIVAGTSDSNNGNVSGNHGGEDCWIVKLDATGTIQWQKSLGGTGSDVAYSIQIRANGGYTVAGNSNSNNGDVSGNHGQGDYWVVQLAPLIPANDAACTAVHIPADGTLQIDFTNEGATVASGENAITPPNNGNDCLNTWCESPNAITNSVWFRFTAPSTGGVEVSTCGFAGFNTQIAVYNVGDCGNFATYTLLAANDDGNGCVLLSSKMNVGGLTPGQNYYIIVDGWEGAVGDFSIKVTPVFANDAACFAVTLPADGSIQSGFTNVNATAANGENAITPPNNGNDCLNTWCETQNVITNSVWFRFVAPSTGAVEVSTCGLTSFDTQIAVYSVGDCGNFATYTLLAANDDGDGCALFSSKMNVGNLTPGQTYYIIVDGWNGATGSFSIKVTPIVISAAYEAVAGSPLLAAYPNPTSNLLTISLEDQLTMQAYTLSDLTGRAVLDVRLSQPIQKTSVDLGALPKGVYLLQVRSGERVFSEKIIVQ